MGSGSCGVHDGVEGYTVDMALPVRGGRCGTFCEKFVAL